jgi:adenine-specific DNA-methyltransferase
LIELISFIQNGKNEVSVDYSIEYDGKASREDVIRNTPLARLTKQQSFGKNPINKLVHGDNLPILRTLLEDEETSGKISLVYIDPPFSTRRKFNGKSVWYQDNVEVDHNTPAYEDNLLGSHYIEFLRRRLILLYELLSPDGSIYVQLDEKMAFPIKVIMDEIFGESRFRNWITRRKCSSKNYTRNSYGNITDYIMYYSKSKKPIWNQPFQEWKEDHAKKEFPRIEEGTGRRFKPVPIYAQGVRNGETGKTWRGMAPPKGKHWFTSPEKLEKLNREGRIYWSPTGNPRKKVYLDESKGIAFSDLWMNYRDPHNQNISITGYPTEKNLEMLKMIINASSNERDIVLDCFVGSGTTLKAAQIQDRKWIGIDSSPIAIKICKKRIEALWRNESQPMFGSEQPGFTLFEGSI